MKKINLLKCAVATLCCVTALTFASCKKGKMKFSPAKVEVSVGATSTVNIKKGTAPFTATSSDNSIASVKANNRVISVKGEKAGSVTITVVDKKKKSGKFNVTVKDTGKKGAVSATETAYDNSVTLSVEEGEYGELVFVKE